MKITKSQLKKVIKEELTRMLNENPDLDPYDAPEPSLPSQNPYHPSMVSKTETAQDLINRIRKATAKLDLRNHPERALEALVHETAERILSAYDDEVPPSLVQYIDLIVSSDSAKAIRTNIRSNFNKIWTDLVQYHRDRGDPGLQPIVVHNLRSINSMIRSV